MALNLVIRNGNAAFEEMGRTEHTAELLREIANRIELGTTAGLIKDANGNTVGEYDLRED